MSQAQPSRSSKTAGHTPISIVAVVLEVFLSLGALGGGLALMLGPRGEIIPLPPSELDGSIFPSYFVPGLILFAVLGVGPLVVAYLAWRSHRLAPALTLGVGGVLLIWMAAEILTIGYSNALLLQPFYIGVGVVISLLGLVWLTRERRLRRTPPRGE